MNKNIIMAIALGAAVLLGFWWYAADQKASSDKVMMEEKAVKEKTVSEKESMVKTDEPKKADETMMKTEEGAMMVKGGQYAVYDPAKIAFAKEGKVVLFFRASWCPSCRALDADIKANLGQIPQDVLILDVDYDKYADLKKQYAVTYQHTMIQVDQNGAMIARWSGSPTLSDFLKEVK